MTRESTFPCAFSWPGLFGSGLYTLIPKRGVIDGEPEVLRTEKSAGFVFACIMHISVSQVVLVSQ